MRTVSESVTSQNRWIIPVRYRPPTVVVRFQATPRAFRIVVHTEGQNFLRVLAIVGILDFVL